MDELELLKKDWKKHEKDFPQLKASEIYPMLLKKSSSIVKWIFIISLLELGISTFLNIYLTDEQFWNQVETIHLKTITVGIYIINYLITFIFIYFFYKNYQQISTTDTAARLMENILKTRKIVKYYIMYVLISTGITTLLFFAFSLIYFPEENPSLHNPNLFWAILIGIVVTAILLAIVWGVYTLLYGILLRKLKRNYKELKNMGY